MHLSVLRPVLESHPGHRQRDGTSDNLGLRCVHPGVHAAGDRVPEVSVETNELQGLAVAVRQEACAGGADRIASFQVLDPSTPRIVSKIELRSCGHEIARLAVAQRHVAPPRRHPFSLWTTDERRRLDSFRREVRRCTGYCAGGVVLASVASLLNNRVVRGRRASITLNLGADRRAGPVPVLATLHVVGLPLRFFRPLLLHTVAFLALDHTTSLKGVGIVRRSPRASVQRAPLIVSIGDIQGHRLLAPPLHAVHPGLPGRSSLRPRRRDTREGVAQALISQLVPLGAGLGAYVSGTVPGAIDEGGAGLPRGQITLQGLAGWYLSYNSECTLHCIVLLSSDAHDGDQATGVGLVRPDGVEQLGDSIHERLVPGGAGDGARGGVREEPCASCVRVLGNEGAGIVVTVTRQADWEWLIPLGEERRVVIHRARESA
mmetsp:Transcript_52824/g.140444  ORF Transcript_52824/g.140444 Transcript_52824/m.140444 type:complete len:432 (+) Transcript_52824:674-1969(+)